MGVILDSSILIAAERQRFDLAGFLSAHPDELFFITVITASELLHGCARATDASVRARRARFVGDVLNDYSVLPLNLAEARERPTLGGIGNERHSHRRTGFADRRHRQSRRTFAGDFEPGRVFARAGAGSVGRRRLCLANGAGALNIFLRFA